MPHAVLLGDSILDNGAYVSGGSPLVEQLRSRLPREWPATLLARDGAVAIGVLKQLPHLPTDATHLIVSAGGNDALESTPILNSPPNAAAELLAELVEAQSQFHSNYRHVLHALRQTRLPLLACTIYDAVPGLKPHERMALSLFNDIITRELIAAQVPILDLRSVCNEARDDAAISPIEPSEIGGAKIARELQRILLGHDFTRAETVAYP